MHGGDCRYGGGGACVAPHNRKGRKRRQRGVFRSDKCTACDSLKKGLEMTGKIVGGEEMVQINLLIPKQLRTALRRRYMETEESQAAYIRRILTRQLRREGYYDPEE